MSFPFWLIETIPDQYVNIYLCALRTCKTLLRECWLSDCMPASPHVQVNLSTCQKELALFVVSAKSALYETDTEVGLFWLAFSPH